MSRETFAHCLSGPVSLAEDQWRERDVDRLHALASAARGSALSSLGVCLIGLKTANRPDEYSRSIEYLTFFLKHSKPRPPLLTREAVATQAIREWLIDFCPVCHGKGETEAQEGQEGAQRMKSCPECQGHGKRRYSDMERRATIAGKRHEIERWMADALATISQAEAQAQRTAVQLLERW